MSTAEKPLKAMNMVLTTHFLGTSPPYSTARPGRLMRPTKVAATSCHELSPVSNHDGSEQLLAWPAHVAAVWTAVVISVWSIKWPLLVGSGCTARGATREPRGGPLLAHFFRMRCL